MRVGDRAVAVVGMGSPMKRGEATCGRTPRRLCVYDRAGSVGRVGPASGQTRRGHQKRGRVPRCKKVWETPWRLRVAGRAVAAAGVGLASGQARRGHQ